MCRLKKNSFQITKYSDINGEIADVTLPENKQNP